MRRDQKDEVDCVGCSASHRCWQGEAVPGAGYLVRRTRILEPDELLFAQGSAFEAPYIVTSGCLAITELLPEGRERIVAFRLPGELVGLESWNHGTHRYGAQAVNQSTLCRLRWSNAANAARSTALLRGLLGKATLQSLQDPAPWAGLPAVDRVRSFLESFARRSEQPLPMTRAQIGSYLGMAEETVVRALKALERAR